MTATRRLTVAFSLVVSALALTGCGAASTSTTQPPPTIPPQVITSPSASALAAPPPSPTPTAICTTHACVVSVVEQSLPGTQAKDGSVMTSVTCYKSTVRANPGGTYTVSCDVSYSDQEVWSGFATFIVASDQITWEPEQEVQ